jgi:hypothetical protein
VLQLQNILDGSGLALVGAFLRQSKGDPLVTEEDQQALELPTDQNLTYLAYAVHLLGDNKSVYRIYHLAGRLTVEILDLETDPNGASITADPAWEQYVDGYMNFDAVNKGYLENSGSRLLMER